MKLEIHFSKAAFFEIFMCFILMFFLLNGTAFVITLINGNPRVVFFHLSWIFQILFPFIYALIQNTLNRNSLIKLKPENARNIFLTEKFDVTAFKEKSIPEITTQQYIKHSDKPKKKISQHYYLNDDAKMEIIH